jgi:hypothetical protein
VVKISLISAQNDLRFTPAIHGKLCTCGVPVEPGPWTLSSLYWSRSQATLTQAISKRGDAASMSDSSVPRVQSSHNRMQLRFEVGFCATELIEAVCDLLWDHCFSHHVFNLRSHSVCVCVCLYVGRRALSPRTDVQCVGLCLRVQMYSVCEKRKNKVAFLLTH